MYELSTVADYKEMILATLKAPKEKDPSGKLWAIHIDYGGANFAYFCPVPRHARGTDNFAVVRAMPGHNQALLTKAARELEHEGVLALYKQFEYEYAGATLEYIVGLPEREHEFTLLQPSRTAA
jgi:hypothetical protein